MNKLKNHIAFEIFLLPALISFTLFTIIPLVRTIFYSFTDFNGVVHGYTFVGFSNYLRIFQDSLLRGSLLNTICYTVATVVLINVLSLPLAVFLNRAVFSKIVQRAIFFFPSVISPLLIGYLWSYILYPMASGAANQVLGVFGIGPIPWLSSPFWSKIGILIVAIWTSLGWYTVVNIAYLQSIPSHLFDAAKIDGASGIQAFRYVTIPMMRPAFTVNTLLLLTNGLKVYDIPYALTDGGKPGMANYTITQTIIQRGITERQYGLSSAMSTVFIIIIMVVASLQYFSMSKREEEIS